MFKRSCVVFIILMLSLGCNKAKFSGPSGDRSGANAPLDLSDTVDKNRPNDVHNTGKYNKNDNTYTEPQKDANGNPTNNPNPNIRYDPNTNSWKPNKPVPGGFDPDKPVQIVYETFQIKCSDNGSVTHTYPRNGGSSSKDVRVVAKVQGEICDSGNSSSGATRIAFVVDFSPSMGRHKDTFVNSSGTEILDGNDPLNGSSCGRLEAVRSVVNKVRNTNAQIALIPFAGSTITNSNYNTRSFISVSEFESKYLNSSTLCAYVPQSGITGPGAISTSLATSGTNYYAAINSLKSMLSSSGSYSNQAFFITDGEPTLPSNNSTAKSMAISAAESLRSNTSNLTVNAVLLKRTLSGSRLDSARETLRALTGSDSRIAEASNAGDLANAINSVNNGSSLNFDLNSGKVTFRVSGYSEETLGLQSIERSGNTWNYVTQPFYLHGMPGQTTTNEAIMKLTSKDGTQINHDVDVRYKMSN